MTVRKPTRRERELLAELEQCRIARDAYRDGRNYLWKERGELMRELDGYRCETGPMHRQREAIDAMKGQR